MKPGDSKRLVIDASIARAAGRTDHPISKACRDFLESVLTICHHVVITREISEEWNKHLSKFTLSWRSSMYAKKKVARPKVAHDKALRTGLKNSNLSEKELTAAFKDTHLIEAALETDLSVASLDEAARAIFRKAASRVGPLRPVLWVNPTKEDDRPIEWLKDGAKDEEARQFGFDDSG